ncbi:hypothetical protein E4M02_13700 [Brevundimonas sp. S30B]|uniref:hypothetical protein n=1 Tax=unclassified Brevundimonas TaxID=2622653 RepID=UPI001071B5E2|nr:MULTISPECIES: hypothetical protein [unclassified Brevundimonas]QBX36469.1 hypothetical protein E4M01_01095 [Brevundimonas sp. MF30-B]TFW00721.1 hypothetical protein E4M02_13700 [Brevundimonas sp. S30B]
MKSVKSIAVGAAVTVMLGSSALAATANWNIPHHKPIDQVVYFTDGADQVFGFEVRYCDLSTYREGGLTLFTHTEFYNEC